MVNPSDAAVGHGEHVEAELLAYVEKAHANTENGARATGTTRGG